LTEELAQVMVDSQAKVASTCKAEVKNVRRMMKVATHEIEARRGGVQG
jgi:hypothetical protein